MASVLRRACAWVALVTFSAAFALPFTAGCHSLFDDPGCGGEALVSLHPHTQIESVRPPLVPEHCALCHWLRTFSGARVCAVASMAVGRDVRAAVVFQTSRHVQTDSTGRSSRAPPSSFLI